MSKLSRALCALPLLGVLIAPVVHAQTSKVPLAPTERATLVAPAHPNQITASISAGATLNGGNTRSYGATAGGRFQLIRSPHQLSLDALFTYTAAAPNADADVDTTAQNVVGRARYDIYLSENNALFAALAPRIDRFAGIDLRLQTQVGYLRNLYNPSPNHRLWGEIGYDGTYDNLTPWLPQGQVRAPGVPRPPADEFIHSGRLFVGYTNLLTPLATLNLGVEVLYDFKLAKNVRVNPTIELTSSLSARFKLSLLSRILFDNDPVEGKKKTDYVTTAQLVFTYDSITPPPACPACDCSEEVAAAKSACKQTTSPADVSMAPIDEPTAPVAPAAPVQVLPAPAQPAPARPAP